MARKPVDPMRLRGAALDLIEACWLALDAINPNADRKSRRAFKALLDAIRKAGDTDD